MMTNRRKFIGQAGLLSAGILWHKQNAFASPFDDFTSNRPAVADRHFTSPAVEEAIRKIKASIADPELSWLFENCFPNTLDTTVDFEMINGKPDTYIITGDIDAMWLRDSTAQVWPYLALVKQDPKLQALVGFDKPAGKMHST